MRSGRWPHSRGVVMYEVREYGGIVWGDDVRQSWLFNTQPAEQPWQPRKRVSWRYWDSAEWQAMLARWLLALTSTRTMVQVVTRSDYSEPHTQNHAYRFDASRAARLSEHAPGVAAELVRAEAKLLARTYIDARLRAARQRRRLTDPGDGA